MKSIPFDEIPAQTRARYSGPAPRYTSYPTAPEWLDTFGPNDYARALTRADSQSQDLLSLYVHIPYCKNRCLFCGCASWVEKSQDVHDEYLAALTKEVAAVAAHLPSRKKVGQLHLGGGTPTTLDPPRLRRLLNLLQDHFDFSAAKELAIEVNPSVTSRDQIALLGELGFNRISMGVQDFTEEVQIEVKRIQTPSATEDLMSAARIAGFTGINVDLMYGLPKQRPETWKKTLETIVHLRPDRLAVFGYAHVPWMRPHQAAFDEATLPDTDLRFELFRLAHDHFVGAGYVFIGMDHFALPGDELAIALEARRLWRNFQGYTVRSAEDLIGFGVTSISDVAGSFAQNQSTLESYLARARERQLPTYRGLETSADDRLRRHIITCLMCNLYLNIPEVEQQFGLAFWDRFKTERTRLAPLVEHGIIELSDQEIRVTPVGRMFVRHVGTAFDVYLHRAKAGCPAPRFSPTV